MECNNKGNDYYIFTKNVRVDEQVRKSFNALAFNTFGIDFEFWYQNGYWGDSYIPYALLDGETVVSNISVNIIETTWKNQVKRYIQLGTVMTDEKYRGKGLSRFLMKKVLEDWRDNCDSVYLFANDSVLDFYPKFGFQKAQEYQYLKSVRKKEGMLKKLDMSLVEDRKLLLEMYRLSNPFSALPMENNEGLLMFYCSQFMKESIYYIENFGVVVIAGYYDEKMVCYDIFGLNNYPIDDILCTMAHQDTKIAILGFTPSQIEDFQITKLKEKSTTLFMLRGKDNLFIENQLMFPLLSHA